METNFEHSNHMKKNPFAVPQGYFDTLKKDVLKQMYPKKTHVLQLSSSIMKYAAAAVFLLIVTGSWFIYNQNQLSDSDKLALAVEAELYGYDAQMLEYYSEKGIESELANSDDEYLVSSGYIDETILYENY